MLNKKYKTPMAAMFVIALAFMPSLARSAENVNVEEYDPAGSMFQMITDLEQEKVIWQLEKEKAQLQLDMDRMAAEQMRLKNEMDAMQGSGNTQAEALELERQRLEIEKQKLEAQRKSIDESVVTPTRTSATNRVEVEEQSPIQEKYRLIEIVGAGRQLLATVEDNATGQRKKISVGKDLDGYRIDSVSLDEGVIMSKDGQIATLGIHADQQ